jgi:TctA family transporter
MFNNLKKLIGLVFATVLLTSISSTSFAIDKLHFVIGGLMEENLRRSLLISDGSWTFLWDRPLTLCIMLVIISIVSWQVYNSFFKTKITS